METTRQLYERAKATSGARSDYDFAKRLGITRAAVSKYVNGKATFDDDRAELIAGILGVDPGYVMACAHAERAKSEKSRSNWVRIAALIAASALPPAAGATALIDAPTTASNLYYVNNYHRLKHPKVAVQ